MMPAPKDQRQEPAVSDVAPLEKMFQFLINLHGRIDHAKGLLERFQKEFKDLDDEERGLLMTQAYGIMRIVVNDLLALAPVHGDVDSLKQDLSAAIANIKGETYEADFERILQLLLVCESHLEVWQMLLTNQPVPSDWAEAVWEEMKQEVIMVAYKEQATEIRAEKMDKVRTGRDAAKEALAASPEQDVAERLERFIEDADRQLDEGDAPDDEPDSGEMDDFLDGGEGDEDAG